MTNFLKKLFYKQKNKTLLQLILSFYILYSSNLQSCMLFETGAYLSINELINKSENIYLVELSHIELNKHRSGVIYSLKPVEVIKGKHQSTIKISGSKNDLHNQSSFLNHLNPLFWFTDNGRSKWQCCICRPSHSFEKNNKYLLFPDMLGSMKSAEIINNKNDAWLLYVQNKVKRSYKTRKELKRDY